MYKWFYETPKEFRNIILTSDGELLTGLVFEKYKANKLINNPNCLEKELDIFKETIKWLDIYFSGKDPEFTPKYKMVNSTAFKDEVFDILKQVPFCDVTTYGDIAKKIAEKRGIKRMSAQAVGQALNSNPICIIIPCHRVVGSNNSLVGYGAGIHTKARLLMLEGITILSKDNNLEKGHLVLIRKK